MLCDASVLLRCMAVPGVVSSCRVAQGLGHPLSYYNCTTTSYQVLEWILVLTIHSLAHTNPQALLGPAQAQTPISVPVPATYTA
eukprot:2238331-Rhodomonas_salina.1